MIHRNGIDWEEGDGSSVLSYRALDGSERNLVNVSILNVIYSSTKEYSNLITLHIRRSDWLVLAKLFCVKQNPIRYEQLQFRLVFFFLFALIEKAKNTVKIEKKNLWFVATNSTKLKFSVKLFRF